MRPILFHLGPFPLYSFGVMIAIGLVLSLFLMNRRARRLGFPKDTNDVFDMVFYCVLSGFLGGRLYYVIQNADFYFKYPLHIFSLWEGGLIFYGGVAGSLAGLFIFMKIRKIPYLAGLDFLIPFESLIHAFGRLGCFLNGCCYGKACDLPWAVRFPDIPYPVHPTQLYEAAFDVALFAALYFFYPRRKFDGQVISLYFCGYSAARFSIEFFRADNPVFGLLTFNQWISLALGAFGAALYFFPRNKKLTTAAS